jgi:diguanylate cyclase
VQSSAPITRLEDVDKNSSSEKQPDASTTDGRSHDQTIGYAQLALKEITALRLPADPASFAVWYAYSTGRNPALNETINQIIKRHDGMTISELDHIHQEYISLSGVVDRIEDVGTRIGDEVNQLATKINAAIGSTTSYKEDLAGANQNLDKVQDKQSLKYLLDNIIHVTKKIEHQNQELHVSLVTSKEEISYLRMTLDEIRADSLLDPLTSLANRKHFDQSLDQAIKKSEQNRIPLSLLLCDVDHFKEFNDRFGHITGDDVLRLIASEMRRALRREDIPARYGGEEFAVILPNTKLQHARTVAEHIRKTITEKKLVKRSTEQELGRVSMSIGAAEFRPGDTSRALIERADNNLYIAKHEGRNRVI